MNTIAYFDFTKFLAAFLVAVFLHYNDHFLTFLYTPNPFGANSFWGYASIRSYVLVELFFVFSGILFVIAYQEKIKANLSFFSFLKKRYFRMFPLVMISTLYMYLANWYLFQKTGTLYSCGSLRVKDLLSDMFLAGRSVFGGLKTLNAPVWYISVLMLCYILAYLYVRLSKRSITLHLFYFVTLVTGIIMRFLPKSYPFWNEDIARGLIAFFVGTLLGNLILFYQTNAPKIPYSLRFLFLLLFIGSIWGTNYYFYPLGQAWYTTASSLLVYPLFILCFYDIKWINRICQTSIFRFLGAISYDLYVWNFPIYITLHILITTKIWQPCITSTKFLLFLGLLHLAVAAFSYMLRTFTKHRLFHLSK